MNHYVIYNSTGEIVAHGSMIQALDFDLFVLESGETALATTEEVDRSVSYVLAGVLTDKPTMPITLDTLSVTADDIDTITISGVPDTASMTVDGETLTADGTDILLTFDAAGTYIITAVLFPYLDYEVSVDAV